MVNYRNENQIVKVCCTAISCDLVGQRKILGHSAHNATMGCNFCNIAFPRLNYGSFSINDFSQHLDIASTPRRTKGTHQVASSRYLNATTKRSRDEVKSSTGTSYTAFQRLDYFDCIEHQTIDPMHLLFLDKYLYIPYYYR